MSDLQERNAKAVTQALQAQDAKLTEFSDKLIAMSIQMNLLQNELNQLKQKSMQDLVAQFGSGPTET